MGGCTDLDLMQEIKGNEAKEVSYRYSRVGEPVQMDDRTGAGTREPDLLGRLRKRRTGNRIFSCDSGYSPLY